MSGLEAKQQRRSILYITHYYPPEVNAPAIRISKLARKWVERGHDVTVLTGFPNHPTGVIPKEYSGKTLMREMIDGVNIIRTYLYAAENKGLLKRIFNYLSFMLSAIILGLPRIGRTDVVIASSPQFFVAIAGYLISLVKRVPFIFEVRDVWPEEIVAVGAIRSRFIIRVLEMIEMFLYHHAKLVVAVAEGTIDILVERGIPREKIILMPNGVDFEEFQRNVDIHSVRDKHRLNGEFLVSYIGTHGMAHRLQTVVEAADRLRHNNRIKFLMVGDGAEKKRLQSLAGNLLLENIQFVPQLPHDEAIDYYKASDACLVPLKRADLFTKNIPSKIYEIMASGKPVLLGADGESRRLVNEADAGIAFEPESVESLVESIEKLYKNRQDARRLGENGLNYARKNCRREVIAEKYLSEILKIS